MIKIAIYGKGGIGKSTTSSNISAAFSDMGYKVIQIGCDPKADSTSSHCDGKNIKTILDVIKEKGEDIELEDIVVKGTNGVLCIEAGGPTPGLGCAGRGIITAFEKLEELEAFEIYNPDIIIYDVLGDVVCGGFAMPIRGGYANDVFVVSSGEKMSIYAAANISLAVENFKKRGYASIKGIILNSRNVENEEELVSELANDIGSSIIKVLPRSEMVHEAEKQGKTVIDSYPESEMADEYRKLAISILEVCSDE